MSNMSNLRKILASSHRKIGKYILEEFNFLQEEFGFKEPVIDSHSMFDSYSYQGEGFEIEIVIEWRDWWVTILFVKLGECRTSPDYYKWKGKSYRVYLEDVVNTLPIEGKEQFFEEIRSLNKKKERTYENITEWLDLLKRLLRHSIERILLEGTIFFEKVDENDSELIL